MPVVAGVLGLDINGQSYICEETAKYSTQNREYTGIAVGGGFGGTEGKGVIPFIEVTVRLDEGQSGDDVAVRGATVMLRCEDRIVTLTKATRVGKAEVDAAKNSVSCRFEGISCKEVF